MSGLVSNFADSTTGLSDQSQHALTDLQAQILGPVEDRDRSSKGTAFERETNADKVGDGTGREYTIGISCENQTGIIAPTAKPKLDAGVDAKWDGATQMRHDFVYVSFSVHSSKPCLMIIRRWLEQ